MEKNKGQQVPHETEIRLYYKDAMPNTIKYWALRDFVVWQQSALLHQKLVALGDTSSIELSKRLETHAEKRITFLRQQSPKYNQEADLVEGILFLLAKEFQSVSQDRLHSTVQAIEFLSAIIEDLAQTNE